MTARTSVLGRPPPKQWGPYGEQPWGELAPPAMGELAHHGAELALPRDLYRAGGHAHQS
ncbi:MAG TPA: hypothetical protein VG756_27265 [Pseudonocardiaceae bacterium]|nr:hypothetical protein [Pseudonocardiaceae bacterium]